MSEKRKKELYNTITARIIDLRIELHQNPKLADPEAIDERLFRLELGIWQDVKKTLGLEE
jgi:hypothetical protein